MASFTEETLRTRTRRMADMENSTFITDAELRDYINAAIAELHDIVVEKYEDYYLKTSTSMDLSTGDTFDLPNDFYKALGVDLDVGGNTYSIANYSFQERNRHNTTASAGDRLYAHTQYHIQGDSIKFIPTSSSGAALLYYVPVATQFSGPDFSNKEIKSIIPGYEDYVCVTATIACLMKEESDTRIHMARKAEIRARIESSAGKRNAGDSYAITDIDVGRGAGMDFHY